MKRGHVSVGVFVCAMIAGASANAAATPPCNTVERIPLQVKTVSVDGASMTVTSPSDLAFAFQDDDPELGTFVASVYDPVAARPRDLVLQLEAP